MDSLGIIKKKYIPAIAHHNQEGSQGYGTVP